MNRPGYSASRGCVEVNTEYSGRGSIFESRGGDLSLIVTQSGGLKTLFLSNSLQFSKQWGP